VNQPELVTSRPAILPFLKWAGGKRWLASRLERISTLLATKYIEPFLGGGAIYFSLQPQRAVLADTNSALIGAYRAVRDHPLEIQSLLELHHATHSPEYYYEMRRANFHSDVERAAQFIYLNRTCWNGLYRVNLKGIFNVPIGTKNAVILETDDWERTAKLLNTASLLCQDFEDTIDDAREGDVIFADPPYTVKHNLNGFVKYNEAIFSWEDQIRLRNALLRAKKRGAIVFATNADHASVRDLYSADFTFASLERASVLSGNPAYRGRFNELLVAANHEQ
jgi:DNA adenine methylase